MIDFPLMPGIAPKSAWVLSGTLYYMVLAIYYRWAFVRPQSLPLYTKKKGLVVLVFLYCVLAIYCGDWVHLQVIVKGILNTEYIEGYSLEKIYFILSNILGGNYLLFRVIVWGTGLFFMMKAFKLCKIDPYRSLYFLFGIYITSFAYSRAGTAHALFFCGLVMFFVGKEDNNKWFRVIALLLIIASSFAHRSMLALVVLFPLSLVPINNRTLLFFILGGLMLSLTWSSIFHGVMDYLMSSEEYAHRLELYENISGSQSLSYLGGFYYLWSKGTIHVLFWVSVVHLYRLINKGVVSLPIQAIFRFSIILYIFTIIMFFRYGNLSAFYYRYENMLYIPITIMMSYLFQNGYIRINTYQFLFWIFAISQGKDFIHRVFFM